MPRDPSHMADIINQGVVKIPAFRLAESDADAQSLNDRGPTVKLARGQRVPLSDLLAYLPQHKYIYRPTGDL